MKTLSSFIISSLAAIAFASGCVGEMPTAEEEVAFGEEPLCENRDGVNAAMAAIAVAAGREMRRIFSGDFSFNYSTGRLETTSTGRARCANSWCPNVEAALALQNAAPNTVKFPGNIVLNPTSLKNALKANYEEWYNCWQADTCDRQYFDLKYTNWESGSCDVKFFFNVYEQNSTTRITDTARLLGYQNNLIFLGYPENKMLNFYIRNGQISLDPTSGLNESGTTTSGSCTAACTKYSTTSVAGQCCSCNGVTKTFARSAFSTSMYLCQ